MPDGLIRSTLLSRHGFVHGFSLRRLGQNRQLLAEALGYAPDRLFEVDQVHGHHVVELAKEQEPSSIASTKADALVTRHGGQAVAVRTADCVPVLLAHPATGAVAVAHVGWRGAVAGVLEQTVAALDEDRSELLAAIGPHIRVNAFEIGEEVAGQLERAANGRDVVDRLHAKPHGDLTRLVAGKLIDLGLLHDHIDDVGGCTYEEAERFFSHRRQGAKAGRHLSVIVC